MKVRDMWEKGQIPTGHIFGLAGKWQHVLAGGEFGAESECRADYWDCVEMECDIDTSEFFISQDERAERMHYGAAQLT